ncbi:MAG: hypothetical protein KDA32_12415 [Phycisphaerales bacterium]|nr:hypothetical protein [Phycisphaerales bacterium]
MRSDPEIITKSAIAGLLAWVIPGAGHFWLGKRGFAAVFFVAITFPYFTGLALGGIKLSVNPYFNGWLFLAEMGIGGYTLPAYLLNERGEFPARKAAELATSQTVPPTDPQRMKLNELTSYYPGADVAQIYLAVAGLLNLLAIFDAMMRVQAKGLPVFYHEAGMRLEDADAETARGSS